MKLLQGIRDQVIFRKKLDVLHEQLVSLQKCAVLRRIRLENHTNTVHLFTSTILIDAGNISKNLY